MEINSMQSPYIIRQHTYQAVYSAVHFGDALLRTTVIQQLFE